MKGAAQFPIALVSLERIGVLHDLSTPPTKGGDMQIGLMPWPCPDQAKHVFRAILHSTEGLL